MSVEDELVRHLEAVECEVAHLRAALMRHRVRTASRVAGYSQPLNITTHDGSVGVDAMRDEPCGRCVP